MVKCNKCETNQITGRTGTKDWNICATCLQEIVQKEQRGQTSGRGWCGNCSKLQSFQVEYRDGKKEKWEDKKWSERDEAHRNDCPQNCQLPHRSSFCSDACELQKTGKLVPKRKSPDQPPVYLGKDFDTLQLSQQEGRKKTDTNWKVSTQKPDYERCYSCPYCQKEFSYDKSIKDFFTAEEKVEKELKTHKKTCSLKNNKNEAKKKAQEAWDKERKSKERVFYSCDKCSGKVMWDKSIADAEQAKKQALADINWYEKEECGMKDKKDWIIAIYFSPNQGGNQHAPLSYLPTNEENYLFQKDNQGEIYQEQGQGTNYLPYILGGIGILTFIALIIYFLARPSKSKRY